MRFSALVIIVVVVGCVWCMQGMFAENLPYQQVKEDLKDFGFNLLNCFVILPLFAAALVRPIPTTESCWPDESRERNEKKN